jgi:exodeoxyribonuclease V beta subunit
MHQPSCRSKPPKNFDLVKNPLAGFNLIDASAGTGKTYTICGLVLRLLLEKNLPIEQILVLTYTEAATEDLRDRIRQKIRQAIKAFHTRESDDPFLQEYLGQCNDFALAHQQLTDALRSFDEAAIFTIHGFCLRILREYSFESATLFDTELITDETFIIREIVEDFWRLHFYRGSKLFIDYANRKTNPEKLLGFLINFIPHPQITFIPAVDIETAASKLSALEENYIAIYRDICCSWPAARKQVHDIFRHSTALNRRFYGHKKISRWMTAMDAMATACSPTVNLFDSFRQFTSSRMTAATKKNETTPHHPFFELCEKLADLQNNLQCQLDNYLLALHRKLLVYFRNEFQERKKNANIYSFDDLLRRLHDALAGRSGSSLAEIIVKRYPAALIDEFQDTDPLQFAIFSSVYQNRGLLFLIGDPKQAIYSFRGADIFTYMSAAAGSHSHHTLAVNYRSSLGLVNAVNTLFSRAQLPFVFKEIDFQPVTASDLQKNESLTNDNNKTASFILWFFSRARQSTGPGKKTAAQTTTIAKHYAREMIIAAVTSEITRMLSLSTESKAGSGNSKILPSDIAILVRTNREARLMQQALNSCRVPSVLHSGEDLFASQEAREMEIVLSGVAEPNNLGKVKTALITNIIGLSESEVQELDNQSAANQPTIEAWQAAFFHYFHLWQHHSFIRMFWAFMQINRVRVRVLGYENGERSLTNILHLAELLHHAAEEKKLTITGLLRYLRERLSNPHAPDIEQQLRLESDADRVRIVTIHKAKGLEYPIVFCPFAWEGTRLSSKKGFLFHPREETTQNAKLVFDAGSADLEKHLELALQEELAENLRLLYVSLTRAVHRCYFAWGAFSGADTSAPAYLLHQPRVAASNKVVLNPGEELSSLIRKTACRFKNLTDQEIIAELQEFVDQAGGDLKLSIKDECPEPTNYRQADTNEQLLCRKLTGKINTDWRISSFSSLTSKRQTFRGSDLLPDRDAEMQVPLNTLPVSVKGDAEQTILTFPRGARAGIFFHELFEQLNFNSADKSHQEELITAKLMDYGYELSWHPVIMNMLDNALHVNLHAKIPELQMSKVPNSSRINEMEFYFPLSSVTPSSFTKIFAKDTSPSIPALQEISGQLGRLTFSPLKGFMKGFIDMVFEYGGKYYLLDWKSNYLGNRLEDYHQSKLAGVMQSRYYFLQYHIYCLALHQYLQNRLPGYQYDSHFGGIFYIFLRGVDRHRGPDYGIYYELPDSSLISRFSETLLPANS